MAADDLHPGIGITVTGGLRRKGSGADTKKKVKSVQGERTFISGSCRASAGW